MAHMLIENLWDSRNVVAGGEVFTQAGLLAIWSITDRHMQCTWNDVNNNDDNDAGHLQHSLHKSPGVLHTPAQLKAATDKKPFQLCFIKGKQFSFLNIKRKTIPLDDGGWNLPVLSAPHPHSCMLYLGQSNWPEGGKKTRKPTSTDLAEKQVKISFGHGVTTVLAEGRVLHLSVKQGSLALLYSKAWETRTDLELEVVY